MMESMNRIIFWTAAVLAVVVVISLGALECFLVSEMSGLSVFFLMPWVVGIKSFASWFLLFMAFNEEDDKLFDIPEDCSGLALLAELFFLIGSAISLFISSHLFGSFAFFIYFLSTSFFAAGSWVLIASFETQKTSNCASCSLGVISEILWVICCSGAILFSSLLMGWNSLRYSAVCHLLFAGVSAVGWRQASLRPRKMEILFDDLGE